MRRGVLGRPGFRLLFAGSAVSSLGDRLVPVALVFAVLDLTGSVTDLGIVLAAQTIPLVAFVLLGGVWGDRLPRQKVMLSSDLVRALTQAGTAFLLLAGDAHVWELVVLQAGYGIADAFFEPASTAVLPAIVDAGELQDANALLALTASVSAVLGPALAGVIVATIGPGWGLAIDGVTFVVSAGFLSRLTVPDAPLMARRGMIQELREGWRSFRSVTWLWVIAGFFALFLAFGYSPLQVLGPQLARRELGGAGVWAAISVARGIGSLAGGGLGLRWHPAHPFRAAFLIFLIGTPALLIAIASDAPVPLILAFALIDGITAAFFNTVWATAVQTRIPADELSRVASWDLVAALTPLPVGQSLAGPVAGLIGTGTALYGAGAVTFVLLLTVLAIPAIRNFR